MWLHGGFFVIGDQVHIPLLCILQFSKIKFNLFLFHISRQDSYRIVLFSGYDFFRVPRMVINARKKAGLCFAVFEKVRNDLARLLYNILRTIERTKKAYISGLKSINFDEFARSF
jgi:hypothetical protein